MTQDLTSETPPGLPAEASAQLPELASLPDVPTSAASVDASLDNAPSPLSVLNDVKVTVQAVLGGMTLPIADLLDLRGGSVVELDRRVGELVDLVVNGHPIARGELVLIDGGLGLTLTEIVRPER